MIAHADIVSHAILAVAAVALVAWSAAAARGVDRHAVAVAGAAVAALIALSPPVEAVADETYTGHMLQHLALVLVVAPGLAWGCRPAWSRPHRVAVPGGIRRALRRLGRTAAAVGLPVALVATHLTAWYGAALQRQFVHDVEHLAYLAAAFGLWSLVLGRRADSAGIRIGAVAATIVATAVVGIVLTTSGRPLVPTYQEHLGWTAALADQQRAGALMWTVGMVAALPLLVLSFWRWAAGEQRRRERAESLTDRAASATDDPPAVPTPERVATTAAMTSGR